MAAKGIKSSGPSAPKSVPSPGATSSVGPSGKAPEPRIKSRRDYRKKEPHPASAPSPFGSVGY